MENSTKKFIIAIDGPSGTGKSTLADSVAKKLKVVHVNTGSMYRAITYYFIKNKIEITKENVLSNLENIHLDLKHINGNDRVFLNDEDVTDYLRYENVSNTVAIVAAIPEVRKKMVHIQIGIAEKCSLVMEGRDIGSVVFPNANVKLFLKTDSHKRAIRRSEDLKKIGQNVSVEQIEKELIERDRLDTTREVSPLIQTEDSIEVDTTETTVEESTAIVMNILKEKGIIE